MYALLWIVFGWAYIVLGVRHGGGLRLGEGSMMPLWVCFHMFEFLVCIQKVCFYGVC